ncbi:filamentous hemagglutinin N-terminal domain-containing protein [Erwinia sp. S38]|uniref:two-partner secretion domain-containing protein n=1 Tax=Erwinia sp. S38 TaxID=2769338 RepID=UPI00190BFA17|nr:filamentous hemagglutinin N-terminal domain-containing protein [Erwinia sp. S38]MBK0001057.1 filamentous hemagglutinin N-terminal domain-containing protein [Erwinia sp. S38]
MENKNAVIRPLALAVALSFIGGASAVGTGTVVSGSGSIIKNGNQVKVQQNTDKMIVNWNNMNVGKNESLKFNQPNVNAAVLNKINSIDPTVIAGALNANGKVFIVNPNGVLISKGSSINVGSLIASSLDISNKDFLSGKINLKGNGKGKIVNEGDITAAKDVALVGGGEVTNNGKIYSKYNGTALASGSDITLYFPEMGKMSVKVNKGSLNALINNGGIIISDRGDVTLTAWATDTLTRGVINNTGVLEARGVQGLLDGGVSLSSNGDVNLGGQVAAHYARKIEAVGKNVNVSDGTVLSAESTVLSSTRENGYVKVGRIDSKRGTPAISADNVLTTAAGNKSTFSSDVEVYTRTPGKNIDIADTSVKTESQIRSGKGVVSAGLINAVAESGNALKIQNAEGDINVNNAQQNYGKLTLNTDKTVNINRQMTGESLQISAQQVNQAAGAKINMENFAQLYSASDLKQNADIVSDSIILSSNNFQQSEGTNTVGNDVNYQAVKMDLSGNTQADTLNVYANKASESAKGKISANRLELSSGDYDFSAGKNRIDTVRTSVNSLSLSNTEDISLDFNSSVDEVLNIKGDKNVYLNGDSNLYGNSNITAAKDVIVKGRVQVGGDLTVSGNNITSESPFEWDNEAFGSLNSNKSITLVAKNDIFMPTISVTDGRYPSWGEPESNNINNLNVTAKNIKLDSINVKGNTNLTATNGSSGNITLGDSDLKGNLTVKASGDMTLNKNLVAGGDVNINANNLLSDFSEGQYPWLPKSLSSLTGKNVNVQIDNDIKLGGINAVSDNYYSTKDGNASITANNVNLDNLNAMSNLAVSAKDNVAIKAFSPQGYSFNSSGNGTVAKINANTVNIDSSYASTKVEITANKDIHYNKSANSEGTSLTSKNGSVYLGNGGGYYSDGSNHKTLTINAANKVDIKDNLSVFGDLSVTAGKPGISLPSDLNVYGNTVFTTPGDITSSAFLTSHNFNKNLTYILSKDSKITAYNQYTKPWVFGKTQTIIKK